MKRWEKSRGRGSMCPNPSEKRATKSKLQKI